MNPPFFIKYYSKQVFGNHLFYIHPDNGEEAKMIETLLKKKTIHLSEMTLLESIYKNTIKFVEVVAPRN